MEVIITVLFIALSFGVLVIAQKARNPIAIVHVAFFIIFVELLHLAELFERNDQQYDIVYYILAHLSVFLYLVIFTLGIFWLKEARLIPPRERFVNAAIDIGDGWLIASFCGWLLMKAYLVTKYGVSAFSFFSHLAGKDIILHYAVWWETPLEAYLRAFAMGASMIYVIKAVIERGYWRKRWLVSLAFIFFVSINIGTHSTTIGPRRFMMLLVFIGLVTAAWRWQKRKSLSRYLFSRWHKVLVAMLILFSAAVYYQTIRNNFFQPQIADKLLSGNLRIFTQGIAEGMIPFSASDRDNKVAKMFRAGPLEVIYKVIERRNDENLGTEGKITTNAFRMVVPRIIAGKDKKDINADDFLENDMSITPDGPYLVSDVATSLLAIFMADFGFIGVLIAPMVMAFSFVVFLRVPRKGLLSHPVMVLFFFSALLILAANVEGGLIPILALFRDGIILGVALLPLSVIRNEVIQETKGAANEKSDIRINNDGSAMKILHITPAYYPATYWGGPIFSVYHMNNALANIPGVELKVLTTDSAGPDVADRLTGEEKRKTFPYEVLFTRRIADASISAGLMRHMLPLIRWADVVHLTMTFSFPTIPTLALCRMVGKPVVWSLRGAILDDQNRHEYNPQGYTKHLLKAAWLGICRRLIPPRRVTLHVTTTQERDAVAKVFPGARFAIVPNGVEVPDAVPVRDIWLPSGKLRLMFMGRLAPKKGIENLLRAVAKLKMPVSLDLYGAATVGQGGENYGEGLVKLARELGILDKKVHFRGLVNGEAKTRAFMEADVCVIPSYSESFCIVVAEALVHGMPVIVSNRLAWAEVASRGCGLVVGNDPDSLAKAIEKIKNMKMRKMGRIGWQWMRDELGWDVIAGEMNGVYRRMLRGESNAG